MIICMQKLLRTRIPHSSCPFLIPLTPLPQHKCSSSHSFFLPSVQEASLKHLGLWDCNSKWKTLESQGPHNLAGEIETFGKWCCEKGSLKKRHVVSLEIAQKWAWVSVSLQTELRQIHQKKRKETWEVAWPSGLRRWRFSKCFSSFRWRFLFQKQIKA